MDIEVVVDGPDAKIPSVPAWDTRLGWRAIEDVPPSLLREIAHLFDICKELGAREDVRGGGGRGRDAADEEIRAARERHAAASHR